MKIIEQIGSIFDCEENILVNPVNCVGVWGAGLARQFADKFPKTYKQYLVEYRAGFLRPGYCVVHDENDKAVVCLPTKDHWRDPSKLEYIRWGMHFLLSNAFGEEVNKDTMQIAMPKLGCGLGGLNWKDVSGVLKEFDQTYPDVHLFVYDTK
jgi:O-acetyl-ADP-ribose deacetylase (regulator of RNase III)